MPNDGAFRLGSPESQTKLIKEVLAPWIAYLGFETKVDFIALTAARKRPVFLIMIHMQGHAAYDPDESLSIRLFLSDKIEDAFDIKPRSFRLIMHFHNERAKLTNPEKMQSLEWIRSRVAARKFMFAMESRKTAHKIIKVLVPKQKTDLDTVYSLDRSMEGVHVSEASFTSFGPP